MKGEEIKKILLERGIKLAHLAKKMNVTPQSLQNILKSDIKQNADYLRF